MYDNVLLRDAKVSQFEPLVWYANLTAFFCTLSNAIICPSPQIEKMCSRKWWLCWKISVQYVREINFFHSDITVVILHCQKLILYNWRRYLSITPRIWLPCELRPETQKPPALSKPKLYSWVTQYIQHLGKWRAASQTRTLPNFIETGSSLTCLQDPNLCLTWASIIQFTPQQTF